MAGRRAVLAAGLFAMLATATSAGSYELTRRRRLVPRSRGAALERLPVSVGIWREEPSRGDMVDPVIVDEAFAEALRLYDLEVQRDYVAVAAQRIMLNGVFMRKIAQEAKFHWPEFCYATQGFKVRRLDPVSVPMPAGAVRASRFLALRDDRREIALYLTRIGDEVPAGGRALRMTIFRQSLGASLPDGVLLRVSTLIDVDDAARIERGTDMLARFLAMLVQGAAPATRQMIVGGYV